MPGGRRFQKTLDARKLPTATLAEERVNMKRVSKGIFVLAMLAAGTTAYGSSHREALAILNEPCADNTDTYAWVSNGAHDKLYLIMDFNPLHEPGQEIGRAHV